MYIIEPFTKTKENLLTEEQKQLGKEKFEFELQLAELIECKRKLNEHEYICVGKFLQVKVKYQGYVSILKNTKNKKGLRKIINEIYENNSGESTCRGPNDILYLPSLQEKDYIIERLQVYLEKIDGDQKKYSLLVSNKIQAIQNSLGSIDEELKSLAQDHYKLQGIIPDNIKDINRAVIKNSDCERKTKLQMEVSEINEALTAIKLQILELDSESTKFAMNSNTQSLFLSSSSSITNPSTSTGSTNRADSISQLSQLRKKYPMFRESKTNPFGQEESVADLISLPKKRAMPCICMRDGNRPQRIITTMKSILGPRFDKEWDSGPLPEHTSDEHAAVYGI